jgi:hypothetical protein
MYKENIIEITAHGCVNMTFKNFIGVKRIMKLMLRHKSSWWTNKLKFGMRGYTFSNWIMCIETKLKWNETNTINIWDHIDFGWDYGLFWFFQNFGYENC